MHWPQLPARCKLHLRAWLKEKERVKMEARETPSSFLPLRKFDSVLSSLFGMRLALRILRPHSLLTLTLSLSYYLSHLFHLFLISLILSFLSLSLFLALFLSPLCLSSFRLSSLSSFVGGFGQRATYKGLFTASKKSAVFFPTSLPSIFPFWSASFRPPLGLKFHFMEKFMK